MDVGGKSIREKTREAKLKWLQEGPRQEEMSDSAELTALSVLAKRPQIDIDFAEVTYSVPHAGLSGRKDILQGVSGSFRSGELTAIMGSSGAGKSTLLNVLAGYVVTGVKGSIKVNGHPRQMKMFNRLSSYIMQDDLVQSHLTVLESMTVAARLKLGRELPDEKKLQVVDEILEMLGLKKCVATRCEKLSGGQRKRLSVALELVNNPPVVFLDEPTTGLDVVSTSRMVKLLHRLARQGRTIVCTIHQPSAAVFEMFDRLYVMARGKCVYQGKHQELVPFLSSAGFRCPLTHNPADYIIEIIQGEEENGVVSTLASEIQNGKIAVGDESSLRRRTEVRTADSITAKPSLPFFEECSILLGRRMKQQLRNTTTLWIMLLHHIASGSFLGSIFQGVGDDAARSFDNFKFVVSVVVFFMYTHVMCPVLLFPTEVRLLRREYFNQWYSLKSYYTALTISTIPAQVLLGILVTAIAYVLSGQPADVSRYIAFVAIGFLLSFTSEGWGLAIGSLFDEMNGSVIGPASVVPLLAVSIYGMGYGTAIEPGMKLLMSLSYLRCGIVAFTVNLYGRGRPALACDLERNDYCHYKDPHLLLKDLGMEDITLGNQLACLVLFLLVHRIVAFLCLRYRLTTDFSTRVINYVQKVLRRK